MLSYLSEGHFGDDGKHYFLSLGGVRILLVFVEPRFERIGAFASGVLASDSVGHVVVRSVSKAKGQQMPEHVFYSRILRAKG